MNTILSIDVGIKNLAYCLFMKKQIDTDATYKIDKWDIVNLMQQEPELTCCHVDKHNKSCNKLATFSKHSKCYCKTHSKKQTFLIPTPELKPSFINKQKIQTLTELADKYNIKYEKPIKKADLISLINDYIYTICFEPISMANSNASKIDLITIGRNIQYKFDELFENVAIDKVIIENQVSPIANRMKCIQCIIMQYFIMKKKDISIEFISSANKLKNIDANIDTTQQSHSLNNEVIKEEKQKKTEYSERKKMGIQKCLELLNTDSSWKNFFMSHSKKDDLADCYLQGIYFLHKKASTQYIIK